VDVVIDHTLFATVAVPILFDPSNNVIVSPVTPVPVIVGVLLLVEVGDIVLMIGAEGAVMSIVIEDVLFVEVEVFPAASLFLTCTEPIA